MNFARTFHILWYSIAKKLTTHFYTYTPNKSHEGVLKYRPSVRQHVLHETLSLHTLRGRHEWPSLTNDQRNTCEFATQAILCTPRVNTPRSLTHVTTVSPLLCAASLKHVITTDSNAKLHIAKKKWCQWCHGRILFTPPTIFGYWWYSARVCRTHSTSWQMGTY